MGVLSGDAVDAVVPATDENLHLRTIAPNPVLKSNPECQYIRIG